MNIEEYKFSAKGIEAEVKGDVVNIISDDYCYDQERAFYGSAEINKQDVIALAKHFKLTKEDIEE